MLSVKENSDSQMTDCNTILDEPKHHSSKEITTSEMKLEIEVQTIENTTKIAPHSVVEIKDYTRAQIVTEELTQNIVENKLPYSCASCTKTFKTNRKLTVHVRTHTGEKPYSCIYCNKTFSQHGNMKRHEKNHYGEKSIDMKLRTENDSSSEKPLIKENENFDEALESGAKKNYHKHTLEFKLKVINHAKKSGNRRLTARENNINESLVRKWESEEGSLIVALSKVPYACIECQMTFHRSKDLKVHKQLTHLSANVSPKSRSENDGVKSDDMKVGKENVSSSEEPQIITEELNQNVVRTENDSSSEKSLTKENENSDKALESGANKIYHKHTLEFKLEVINHSKKSGNISQTAREYNVNETSARNWVANEESIKDALAKTLKNQKKCINCNEKFSSKFQLQTHNKLYDGKTKKCSNCSFKSCTSIGLEIHDKKCKEEIWTKCCKHCLEIFKSAKELEIHQKECKKTSNSENATKNDKRCKEATGMDVMKDTEINSKVELKQKNEIQTREKDIKTAHDSVVESKDWTRPHILTEELTQNPMPKDLKIHEQPTHTSTANVSTSERPLIKHSVLRSDIITKQIFE